MNVEIRMMGQLGQAAGGAVRTVAVEDGWTAQDLVRELCGELGESFRRLALDADGQLRRFVLLYVDDRPVDWREPRPLHDGDRILLATPIAGG